MFVVCCLNYLLNLQLARSSKSSKDFFINIESKLLLIILDVTKPIQKMISKEVWSAMLHPVIYQMLNPRWTVNNCFLKNLHVNHMTLRSKRLWKRNR